jgi:hypothetical protein
VLFANNLLAKLAQQGDKSLTQPRRSLHFDPNPIKHPLPNPRIAETTIARNKRYGTLPA